MAVETVAVSVSLVQWAPLVRVECTDQYEDCSGYKQNFNLLLLFFEFSTIFYFTF